MPMLTKSGLAAGFALALAACAATPEPNYYLLPAPEVTATVPYSGGTVAVREISLPLYARAQQIASVAEDGSVALNDDHRWADEPPRAATRALAATLKRVLDAPIVTEPWPSTVEPALRVDVTVDRLIGDTGGGDLEFSGQFQIIDIRERAAGPRTQDSFDYRIPIGAPGYRALADTHSEAIGKLALEIADRIAEGPSS